MSESQCTNTSITGEQLAKNRDYVYANDGDFGLVKFYVSEDNSSIKMIYYNPDNEAGGQLVQNNLYPFMLIEVLENCTSEVHFWERLDERARQYLTDINAPEFEEEARAFVEQQPSFTGQSQSSMDAIRDWLKVRGTTRTPYRLERTQDDDSLFFRLEEKDARRFGAIGHLRVDFGIGGKGFYSTWFDKQANLKTASFREELDDIINSLRFKGDTPPLGCRSNLLTYCASNPGKRLGERGSGYVVRTADYSYYFRCKPRLGDYEIYCFTYANSHLLPALGLPQDSGDCGL